MKQYVCEDVGMVLGEMEGKIKIMLEETTNEDKKAGIQMVYDLLKQTQQDWKSDFSWV